MQNNEHTDRHDWIYRVSNAIGVQDTDAPDWSRMLKRLKAESDKKLRRIIYKAVYLSAACIAGLIITLKTTDTREQPGGGQFTSTIQYNGFKMAKQQPVINPATAYKNRRTANGPALKRVVSNVDLKNTGVMNEEPALQIDSTFIQHSSAPQNSLTIRPATIHKNILMAQFSGSIYPDSNFTPHYLPKYNIKKTDPAKEASAMRNDHSIISSLQ